MILAKQKAIISYRSEGDYTIASKDSIMGIFIKDLSIKDKQGKLIDNPITFINNRLKNGNFWEEVLMEYGELVDTPSRTLAKNLKIQLLK